MPAPMPAAVPPLANPAGGYDNPLYAVAAQNTPNGNVETKEVTEPVRWYGSQSPCTVLWASSWLP